MSDVRRILRYMSTNTAPAPPSGIPEWSLGWRLQRALAHGKISVQAMADHLGVSRSTVSRWMNERGAPPKVGFVAQWAWLCKVDPAWLRDGVEPNSGPDTPSGLGVSPSGDKTNSTATITVLYPVSAAA